MTDDHRHVHDAQAMWSTPDADQVLLDADCSPTKTCRNMVGVSFDGFAEGESDLSTAWRTALERDGKVQEGSGTLRDLVFGTPNS